MKTQDLEKEQSARRGIGYFTEDCGTACACCGGKVRRALMKRFVSQQSKGKGFLGVLGNAESRRRQDFDAGKGSRKLGEDQRIVRATARNDEFVNFCFGQDETVQSIDDRECGEDCRGTNEIVRSCAMALPEGKDFFHISMAVIFAPGGFGWSEFQIGVVQEIVEERGEAAALRRESRVFVKALAATRAVRDEGVNEHVGRASVEGEDLLRLGRTRKNCNVGDAAKIERNAAKFRVPIEKIVHIGNERCALATVGDVRRSKITDGRDARASRDDGRLADLQRRGGRSAQKIDGLALMEDGLPVTSDQGDLRWRHSETTASGQGGVAEEFSQTEIQLTESAGGDGVLF